MKAMSYGTLPLVHEVGRTSDTVNRSSGDGSGTGFSFNNLSGYWFNWAVDEALAVYYNDKQAV